MKKIFLLSFTLLLTDAALACSFAPPSAASAERMNAEQSTIVTSANKHYFLKLVPSKWAFEQGRLIRKKDSYGVAFEAMSYGQTKPLWTFKHWDLKRGGDMHLSNDGMNLVVVNSFVKDSADTRAVITYKQGQKVKEYPASYFGVEKLPIRHSCGEGTWLAPKSKQPRLDVFSGFTLKTTNDENWSISLDSLTVKKAKKTL